MLRRDFLFGAAAGAAVVGGGWAASYNPWKVAEGATTCYSQCGEDLIADQILHDLGVDRPTFLDVGAFLPIRSNNTYLFYTRGARGVLVEPNVDLIAELKRARPEDVVLNIGIGFSAEEETADYYRTNFPQRNTFDAEDAKKLVASSNGEARIVEVVKMPLVPINKVIATHLGDRAPDFLSVDTEGLDLAILKTLDFGKYRPKLICAETFDNTTFRVKPDVAEFLGGQGYAVRGQTHPNTLFVDQRLTG
jgi:FkbM family methyltransferase